MCLAALGDAMNYGVEDPRWQANLKDSGDPQKNIQISFEYMKSNEWAVVYIGNQSFDYINFEGKYVLLEKNVISLEETIHKNLIFS